MTKAKLNRMLDLHYKIYEAKQDIEDRIGPRSGFGSDGSGSGPGDPTAWAAIRNGQYIDTLNRLETELTKLKRELDKDLKKVDDTFGVYIARLYYINGYDFDIISYLTKKEERDLKDKLKRTIKQVAQTR